MSDVYSQITETYYQPIVATAKTDYIDYDDWPHEVDPASLIQSLDHVCFLPVLRLEG